MLIHGVDMNMSELEQYVMMVGLVVLLDLVHAVGMEVLITGFMIMNMFVINKNY